MDKRCPPAGYTDTHLEKRNTCFLIQHLFGYYYYRYKSLSTQEILTEQRKVFSKNFMDANTLFKLKLHVLARCHGMYKVLNKLYSEPLAEIMSAW